MARIISIFALTTVFLTACGTSEQESGDLLSAESKVSGPRQVEILIDTFEVGNETLQWNEELTVTVEFVQLMKGNHTVTQAADIGPDAKLPAQTYEIYGKDVQKVYRAGELAGKKIVNGSGSLAISFNPKNVIANTTAPKDLRSVSYTGDVRMQLNIYAKNYYLGSEHRVAGVDLGSLDRTTNAFSVKSGDSKKLNFSASSKAGTRLGGLVVFN